MSKAQTLRDAQVLEIVSLHFEGFSNAKLAARFETSESTIRRIVLGQSHRGVTCSNHTVAQPCPCLACVNAALTDTNLAIAEGAVCRVRCHSCKQMFWRRVLEVSRRRGLVMCTDCDGRRK